MMSSSEKPLPAIQSGLLITIDGPAGSGKTTVSKLLAERLDYQYVDTGALYRCIALEAQKAGIDGKNDEQLAQLCVGLDIQFREIDSQWRLFSNGVDINDQIRTPDVTMLASAISAMPSVRRHLLLVQRSLGAGKSAVFEGRDMGTVVFPDADIKFFLDADIGVRAQRRYDELGSRHAQSIAEVEADMRQRDHDDSHRKLAPLKPADDAVIIDTTHLAIDEVVQTMLNQIRQISHC
jgi:cytidylate kinase